MKGITSLVLFLFLASGSAIAADAPPPVPPVAAVPPIAAETPKPNNAAQDDELFRAVTDGKADEVKRLVNAGANPNAPSGAEKKRALNVGAAAGNKEIVEILIAAGADVKANDGSGASAVVCALFNDKQEIAKLIGAVRTGKITVEELRKNNGVTVPLPAPVVAAPAQASAAQVQKVSDEITKAINEHRIINGMTIEQANKALSVKFHQELDSPDGAVYTAVFGWNMSPMQQMPGGRIRGGVQTGTLFTIWVKDRVVVNWTSEPYLKVPPYGG